MAVLWTLGIETATDAGEVALLRDGELAGERALGAGFVHGRDVAPAIDALLCAAGLAPKDVGLVAVDNGPGSYTGVRVGVATAKGLAMGGGCPVVGVGSLEAMLADAPEATVAVIDGGRARVFVWLPEGVASLTPETLLQRVGPEARIVLDSLGEAAARLAGRRLLAPRPPRAATIGRLGRERFLARGPDDPASLAPVYPTPAP